MSLADPELDDLGSRIRGGFRWKILSETTILVSRIAVAIVLARLLTPRDFGIAGMVLVIANLIVPFADIGVGTALVQRRTIDDRDRSTMFWISLAAGMFFTLAGIAASFAMADFFGEAKVRTLFMVFSLGFLITSIGATQRTLLYRAMDFRRLELRNVTGIVAGVVAAVAVAALGLGPWALIVQSLTLLGVSTVLLWLLVPWRPRFVFSPAVARELGAFGLRSVGASLLTMSNQISDKVMVGRFLGAAPLGVYSLAINTVLMPLTRIVTPIGQVFYPAISRLQDDPAGVGKAWLRMHSAVVAVFAPLMLAIMLTAPDFVPLVFGERWKAAVPALQILAAGSFFQALQGLNPVVLQALNRPATTLHFSVATFVVSLAAYAAGIRWGVVGVATGFSVANALLAIAYILLTARVIGVRLTTLYRSQAEVAQVVVAVAAAMLLVRVLLLPRDSNDLVALFSILAAGVVVYGLMLFWRAPELVAEARHLLRRQRSEPGVTPAPAELGD